MANSVSTTKKFKATVQPVPNKQPVFVELPFDAKEVFGKVRAPVVVKTNGYEFKTTIGAMFGKQVIGFNKEHKAGAKVSAGDKIDVVVALDGSDRTVTPPDDLLRALKREKGAWSAWQNLSPSHQKEHVRAIEDAKTPETRARRLANAVTKLSGVEGAKS